MLNTDAHNPQVKRRMTKTDFVRNLRGINDNADLPEDLLSEIYDNIHSNEIRMKDEVEAAPIPVAPAPGLANALANVGRDLQKEAYMMQSNTMANKTEVRNITYIFHRSSAHHLDIGSLPYAYAFPAEGF